MRELPDLRDPEMKTAAVKIQSVYRGFQTRKVAKVVGSSKTHSWLEVVAAAVTIQRCYKRYKARKRQIKKSDSLPDLKDPNMKHAAVKIQAVYRGFQTRKVAKISSSIGIVCLLHKHYLVKFCSVSVNILQYAESMLNKIEKKINENFAG